MFGYFIPQVLFAMAIPGAENYRSDVNFWCLWMFLTALIAGLGAFFGKYFFAVTGSNITYNTRQDTYKSILSKDLGWHDKRENNSSILTAMLAKDVDKLDGVASESSAIMFEAMFSVIVGTTIGLVYCW